MSRLAIVVIGRNEGERLRRCLASTGLPLQSVVYVDSGSTDGSVDLAQAMGAYVIDLDMSIPFTAGRARNAGFVAAQNLWSELRYVQFVDGDCEVVAGWIEQAVAFMQVNVEVAVVCGRLRELAPDRSIFNALCDVEWDTPPGPAKACGGIALMRCSRLEAVGGFRDDLIAGEEPELCVRLRAAGWQIHRLGADMALHDAAILHWQQWWQRTRRSGYAFAEGAALHGAAPERHWVREARSARLWAGWMPLAVVGGAIFVTPWAWWGLAVYPIQVARLFLSGSGPVRIRLARAALLVIGKFAELSGQFAYWHRHRRGDVAQLIEYK